MLHNNYTIYYIKYIQFVFVYYISINQEGGGTTGKGEGKSGFCESPIPTSFLKAVTRRIGKTQSSYFRLGFFHAAAPEDGVLGKHWTFASKSLCSLMISLEWPVLATVERIIGGQRMRVEWVMGGRPSPWELVSGTDLGLLLQCRAPRRLILPICLSFACLAVSR